MGKLYFIANGAGAAYKFTDYQYDSTVFINHSAEEDYSKIKDIRISNILGKSSSLEIDENYNVNLAKLVNGIYYIFYCLKTRFVC